jgi:hypothetical protein
MLTISTFIPNRIPHSSSDYVYLYTQPDAALVVPKRAFAQPNEALEFVSDARRRVEQSVAPVEARG